MQSETAATEGHTDTPLLFIIFHLRAIYHRIFSNYMSVIPLYAVDMLACKIKVGSVSQHSHQLLCFCSSCSLPLLG